MPLLVTVRDLGGDKLSTLRRDSDGSVHRS
jgi:hypothetical protein